MNDIAASRRRFITGFAQLGLGSSLLPGVLWAQMEHTGTRRVSPGMMKSAAALSGLELSDADCETIAESVNENFERITALHSVRIPNDVAPPFYFSPLVPGMRVERAQLPFRTSKVSGLRRPADLEEIAFWPVRRLAELVRTRAVTSTELTRMYLSRLHRYNPKLNCVVSFLDDVALAQAKKADAEIAAGRYRGPLHGIPWGAKDIMAFKGHKTTWGSAVYSDRVIDETATVIRLLSEYGAVLLAKLSTGELAGGDQWFGGRTNNPWNLDEGSSGSSAGSACATAAGCVAFALGTETSGSILSPSGRCGATGLRPTFGRVSRYGVMALSWTQDRIGPICRDVEDCALVMNVIARPDGRDLSVSELPFNWDAGLDLRRVRVGYVKEAFADADRYPEWVRNDHDSIEQLRSLGFDLSPVTLPDFPTESLRLSVEAAVFHDELLRSGQYKQMTNPSRGERMLASRLIPAVEYLQSQRLRSMMMQQLAHATAGVDVYLAPSTHGAPRNRTTDAPASRSRDHFNMANLACYPALAVPNGFTSAGTPTSISFMARPYREAELLAVAKAYQDATGFNTRQPPAFAAA
ncbi:MAG: amidase [Gammaproteobacteria bacterium]|nr:amidase [Gammaproteobacteria bacterium]